MESFEKRLENLLRERIVPEILTLPEAAKYLSLSKSTIYKMTHYRKIPFSKPQGKKIYFSRTELDKWMLSNPVKTQADIDQEAENFIVNGHKQDKHGRGNK
ncbi:helix-turn-helix domain-containing protein [candidate division KSB1 bacterium]|nr:helix-turn-helix domain-containing protein [candidate division KSB1 bacterium]